MSPEEIQSITLEWALRAIGQWEKEETHAERMARYRRDHELQEVLRHGPWVQEAQEHKRLSEEYRKHFLEQEALRQEQRRKMAKQAVFDQWERQNQTGGWKARAAERASLRVLEIKLARSAKHRDSPGACEAHLDLMKDHDYVDWMFRCHERGLSV